MAVDLMEILPEYFRPILEFQEIMEAEGEAAEEVERTADRLSDNCFIQTCDEATLAYYERLLQISNIGATLEERRRILLLQWNMESLYTLPKLKEFLASAVGEDNYEIKCFYNEYLVKIWISSQTAVMLRNLYNTIFRMTPAHIILEVYGRYLGNYEVPIEYENKIRFFSEFYPRFNLAVLKLDGRWKLDGGRKLNGYDSSETLDFYPVAFAVKMEVTEAVQTKVPRLHIKMPVEEDVSIGAALGVRAEAVEHMETGQKTAFQTAAGSIPQTEAFMHKKNLLNGSWKLNSSRKLDGGRYAL